MKIEPSTEEERSNGSGNGSASNSSEENTYTRYEYTSKTDFLISCVASVVGFGDMWRFPGYAAKYGGGSYLFVWLIYAIVVCIPMCCLEMFLGKLSGFGISKTLGLMSPLFSGLGWAMICLTFFQSLQYSMLISYCVYYLSVSLVGNMWWSDCGHHWNTDNCIALHLHSICNQSIGNNTACDEFNPMNLTHPVLSTEEFFYHFVLGFYPDGEYFGQVSVKLTLSLLVTWLLVGCFLSCGVRAVSKMAYVTVFLQYVGLFIILMACLTQDGALDGLKNFFLPQYNDLSSFTIWEDAIWIIWSVNVGTGGITAISSYNPFQHNCKRDAVIVVLLDVAASVLSAMIVFAGTGIIVKGLEDKVNVNFIRKYGQNLAFIVYPEILSRMDGEQYWSVLFFFMAVCIGLDSEVWMAESVITAFADVYPSFHAGWRRVVLIFVFCLFSFAASFIFCFEGIGGIVGILVQHAAGNYCIVLFALLEALVVFLVYGYKNFENDIIQNVGKKPNLLWRILFLGTAPLGLLALTLASVASNKTITLRDKNLSRAQHISAVSLSGIFISLIILVALYQFISNMKTPLSLLVTPSEHWFPKKKNDLIEVEENVTKTDSSE